MIKVTKLIGMVLRTYYCRDNADCKHLTADEVNNIMLGLLRKGSTIYESVSVS
jgi:hypothetical protein